MERVQKKEEQKEAKKMVSIQMAKIVGNQANIHLSSLLETSNGLSKNTDIPTQMKKKFETVQKASARGEVIQRVYVLNSTTLKNNLNCSEAGGNWEAHHIIPNSCMSKLGVTRAGYFGDFYNQAWNGIMLPNNEEDYGPNEAMVQRNDHAYVLHNSGHPDYNSDVKARLTGDNAQKKRDSAQAVAQSIKTYLKAHHAGSDGKAIKPHPNINTMGNV